MLSIVAVRVGREVNSEPRASTRRLHGEPIDFGRRRLHVCIKSCTIGKMVCHPSADKEQSVAISFKDVIQSKYLVLTTFTKDGRPKPTPVWGVPEGDKLLVITGGGSWKVKRIRNTPRVAIAKSAALGKPKSEKVEAVARVLPKSETRRVYNAVLKRYWYHAWWFYAHSIVRGGIDKVHIGLEIEPAA
jgi:uncharacterized protein